MSETEEPRAATENSEKTNTPPPATENSEKPSDNPTKTEQVTKNLEKVKLESNGVPASGAKRMSSANLTEDQKALKEIFVAFSKFGDTKSDGKQISLSQSDKWMKQAKVIDGKTITTTDTGICFKKFKALKISFNDYLKYIEDLAKTKKMESKDIITKMVKSGKPAVQEPVAGAKAAATVDRLTDTSKYTGTHKQRFDSAGRGKGKEGRTDVADTSGYVSGYQNKNTYDKTH